MSTDRELTRINRRRAFDRGNPAALPWTYEQWAEDAREANRLRDDANIAAGRAARPINSWEDIAGNVDESVWERIIGDLGPESRAEALRVRPLERQRHLRAVP